MSLYESLFVQYNVTCSQVLVLASDFYEEERRANIRANIETLLALGVVPVVNENDAVSAPPDSNIFTDNDSLAALIGAEMGADLVVLLTDVDGLYTAPPGTPGAQRWSTTRRSSLRVESRMPSALQRRLGRRTSCSTARWRGTPESWPVRPRRKSQAPRDAFDPPP